MGVRLLRLVLPFFTKIKAFTLLIKEKRLSVTRSKK